MSIQRPTAKQTGDREIRRADHFVMIAGYKQDGTVDFFPLDENGVPKFASAHNANDSTTAATLTQAFKTVALSTVPEALAAQETLVETVTITAQKDRTTANTGTVWVGFTSADGTQLHPLDPGDSFTMVAPDGKKLDLAGIYVDVTTNGDGVLYESGN